MPPESSCVCDAMLRVLVPRMTRQPTSAPDEGVVAGQPDTVDQIPSSREPTPATPRRRRLAPTAAAALADRGWTVTIATPLPMAERVARPGAVFRAARREARYRVVVLRPHFAGLSHQWAFCALTASPGARAYYDTLRARGAGHHAALRQLGNRLVGILHGCLKTRTRYAEATAWAHQATTAA
jgi:hypothetical protein